MALGPVAVGTWDTDHWRADSACRDADLNLFFPAGVTGPAERQIREAKAICAACPVRKTCLSFAIETNQEYGIWGGTTEDERAVMKRLSRRPAALSA